MSSQFTTQSMGDYLSALSSVQSSITAQSMEDQDILDSQKSLLAEQKQRGIELLSTASIPVVHMAYKFGTTVKTLAQQAMDFKDKVETVGKQITEAPDSLENIGKTFGNKVSNIGEDAISKLKNTASEKMSGITDEAQSQGASIGEEAQSTLGSIFENSRIGNMFGRIKQVFTPGEVQAQQLQQRAFEQDPEAGIRDVAPEVKPVEASPQASPESSISDVAESAVKDISTAGESAIKDVGSTVSDIGKTAGESAGEAVGEAVGEGVASLVPGLGTAVEAGLLLYQGIEGLKDLFDKPHVEAPPPIVNEAQPTFQAGI
jgi:cell division septum initiation protein DivIVA